MAIRKDFVMAKVTMLTTYDNKVDPFEDYEGWRAQDEDVLHHPRVLRIRRYIHLV